MKPSLKNILISLIRPTAFTLMETMIVVIIVSLIAVAVLPQHTKAVERAYERDAIDTLKLIHAAEQIYFARIGLYWPPDANDYFIDDINNNLNLNIIENGLTYTCNLSSPRICWATRTGGAFEVGVQSSDALQDGVNPCCRTAGDCPTLADCT